MKIFLVRHGETGGNVARRHQAEHTPLTKRGEEQVAAAAEILKTLNPTHLLSSPLVRTIETARVIGNACDLIPELNAQFVELKRPPKLHGHHHKSFRSLAYYFEWYIGFKNPFLPDGESYRMLRARIADAQAHLATYPDDARVIVVSHSVFINLFLVHMCSKRALTPVGAARAFWHVLTTPNTKIVPLTFNKTAPTKTCAWSLDKELASSLKLRGKNTV